MYTLIRGVGHVLAKIAGYTLNSSRNSENDIDGVMEKILKQSYLPLTFEKFFAIYMMWYDDELVKKFHGEVFPTILNRELGEDVVSVCMSGYLHSAPHRVIAVINKNYLDSEQVKEQRSII